MKHGFGYYNYLTDAFEHHQLSLLITPPKELLKLKDPFDPAQNRGLVYADLSLFKGKYYMYFGPAPVLLLFWPARLIPFLPYMPEPWATMIFCTVGFVASLALLFFLVRRFHVEVPPWMLALSIFSLGLGPPVAFILRNADVYHVPISCAYMCVMLGLLFLFYGMSPSRPRVWAVLLSSLSLGLAVASRPVDVAYGVVFLPFTWELLRSRSPGRLVSLALLWGPFMFVLCSLFLYNYLRFGSIFDFGIKYAISSGAHLPTADIFYTWNNFVVGVRRYLFARIHFQSTFPFVAEDGHAVGLFYMCPFVLFLGATSALGPSQKMPGLKLTVIGLALMAVLQMCVLSFVIYSFNVRYQLEFEPLILLAATLVWLALSKKYAGHPVVRRLVHSGGVALITYSCLINLAWSINGRDQHFLKENPAAYRRLQSAFDALAHFLHV